MSIMAGLVARDAVVRPAAVAENAAVSTIPRLPKGNACVFFSNPDQQTRANYRGIISSNHLAENGDAATEALALATPLSVADSQPVVEVLKLLRGDGPDCLPVFDDAGDFLGIINQRSILEALLKRERELLRKTREFRQTSHDDKERRYETTRRLEQTNLAFRKMLTALARPENLDSFKQALEALTVVADAGWAQLALCDESGKITQRVLTSHPSVETFPPNYQAENQMRQVITDNGLLNRSGSAVPVDEASGERSAPRSKQVAFLGVPLAMDERRFGCVYLWDKIGGRAFVDDDEVLLSSLAHAISITLAHAIDHSRRKRLESELDLLAVIAREAGGAASIDCVANIVLKQTDAYWNWDAFALCISRCHGRKFQAVLEMDKSLTMEGGGAWSESYDYFEDVESEGLGSSTSPQVNRRILSGEPVLINRLDLMNVEMMQPFGNVSRPSASLIYVPINGNKRVIGVLTIQSYKKSRFNFTDMAFLQRIADAVAPAFRRCLAERTTRAFFDLTRKLSAASTPHQAARFMMEAADDLIGWDACSLHFYHPESDKHSQVLLIDSIDGERVEFQKEGQEVNPGGLAQRSIKEGPIIYLRPEPRFDKMQCEPFGSMDHPSASLLYVPLIFKENVLGVLSVQSYTVNAYDQGDLDLLTALADQCSGAIERIRKS